MTVPIGIGSDVLLCNDPNKRMREAQGEQYSTNDNPIWKSGSVLYKKYRSRWSRINHAGGFQYRIICPLDFLLNNLL